MASRTRRGGRLGRLALGVLLVMLLAPVTAQAQPEVIEYYALDHLGSVRVVFDVNGTVVARADYAPFGDTTAQVGTLPRRRPGLQTGRDESVARRTREVRTRRV